MSEKVCPNSPGHYSGSFLKDECQVVHIRKRLACNSWKCPVCNPRKVKNLRRRILKGRITQYCDQKDGFRSPKSKYLVKMITLTCPGKEYREKYSPGEVDKMMKDDFNRLLTAFRKEYGKDFEYFLAVEPQRDGYPHFHVIMVGRAVVDRSVYWFIRRLWNEKYGQGFVDVQWRDVKNIKHAVLYVTKYLTKCPVPMRKYMRVFTNSRSALEPKGKAPFWIRGPDVQLGGLSYPEKQCLTYIPPFRLDRDVWEALSPKLRLDVFPQLYNLSEFCLYPDTVPF